MVAFVLSSKILFSVVCKQVFFSVGEIFFRCSAAKQDVKVSLRYQKSCFISSGSRKQQAAVNR